MCNLQSKLVSEPLIVFVTATTGQGDPPTNMKVDSVVLTRDDSISFVCNVSCGVIHVQ